MTDSKYCYPGTNVLINKFDIRDFDELQRVERTYTGKRMLELELKPIASTFDLKHLQKLHQHIFKDLYDWAGKIREVDISKANSYFAPTSQIKSYSDDIFRQLKNERFLKGLDFENFCERAGHYLGEINALHPFREGNGRTQREFMRNLAQKNGYNLAWENVDRNELVRASEASFLRGDNQGLVSLIEQNIENRIPDKELIRAFEDRFLER